MSETITETAPAPAATPPAGPGGAAPPAKPADIFAAAEGGEPAAAGGDRPDWCPEQFWDPEKKTVKGESLAKSWTDFRGKVARGEGKVPDAPEAYVLPVVEGISPELVKADDPLWTEIRGAAHKAGVTQSQLDALLKPYLGAVAKLSADSGAEPDQAQTYATEIGKLGPNGRAVVADIGGWLAGLHARGVLTATELSDLRMVATADGVRALGKLRELSGERAIPTEALDADTMNEADARRTLRDGYAKGDDAMVLKGRRALEALERRGMLGSKS